MEIEINKNQKVLNLKIAGNVDSVTAPQFESEIRKNIEGITAITIDFQEVKYISSAGLRVLIVAKKSVDDIKLINISDEIKDVFEMTGFDSIFGL